MSIAWMTCRIAQFNWDVLALMKASPKILITREVLRWIRMSRSQFRIRRGRSLPVCWVDTHEWLTCLGELHDEISVGGDHFVNRFCVTGVRRSLETGMKRLDLEG